MTTSLTLHVPPDASPEGVQAILQALASTGDSPLTPSEVREQAAAILGKQPRGEALALLRDLGVVETSARAVMLTPRGARITAAAEAMDLLHGLSYIAWTDRAPERLSRLWTYRTALDLLWERAPMQVDASFKKQLVEDLLARAESVFADTEGFSAARASIGPKSVDGVLRWLEALHPAVTHEKQISRRQRCQPSVLLLALSAAMARVNAEHGADFRLGPEERDWLCRACFLEPSALDAMLDWTVQTNPAHVRWGTLNARYGRQIVLTAPWVE